MHRFPAGSHGLRHGGADSSHAVSHSKLHETHFRPSAEIETKMEIKTLEVAELCNKPLLPSFVEQ